MTDQNELNFSTNTSQNTRSRSASVPPTGDQVLGPTSDPTLSSEPQNNPVTPPATTTDSGPDGGGSANHRWRFDIDLNFDPGWLVTPGGGSGRQLPTFSMLNDWMRNHPVNFSIPRTNNSANPPQEIGSGTHSQTNRPTHSVSDTHIGTSAQNHPRSRMAYHRSSTSDIDPDADYMPAPLASASARRDPHYVVDMDGNQGGGMDWENSNHEDTPRSASSGGSRGESDNGAEPSSERTPVEIIRHSPEARAIIQVAERYSPFLLILLLKALFDHGSGIICFLTLLVTFTHANSLVKKEVAKQSKRNLFYLAMIAINLMVCIVFMYYVFQEEELYYAIVFLTTAVDLKSFPQLLWIVGVSDYIAKFVTVIVKIAILSLPAQLVPFQKRGKFYLFVEQSSQFYRSCVPIMPWITYLVSFYDGTARMFGFALAGFYAVFKLTDIWNRSKAWKVALAKLLQTVHYGTIPTTEELANVGVNCPICHDSFVCPTKLNCSHIFCEECVSTWFDRERTCPMCRAKVVDDPAFRDGSTSHFIQLF